MTTLTSIDALRTLYDPVRERSAKKELPQIDAHARRFIGLSPFLVIGSGDAAHGLDSSPRGGAPGFVQVVDAHTLLIPDAPGNNRLDTLENIARAGASGAPVGLLFLVPGVDETLRINGRAVLSTDAAERQRCAEPTRLPKLVIRVAVQSCYLHCAKSLMRSHLWDADRQIERAALPSMGEMMRDQIREFHGDEVPAESQADMLERYRQTL